MELAFRFHTTELYMRRGLKRKNPAHHKERVYLFPRLNYKLGKRDLSSEIWNHEPGYVIFVFVLILSMHS